MRATALGFVGLGVLSSLSCQSAPAAAPAQSPSESAAISSGPSGGQPAGADAPGLEAPPPAVGAQLPPDPGVPCGELGCKRYPDAVIALETLLRTKPQIIGVGETHALKDAPGVETATARFERDFMPVLAKAGASELIVELLGPATGCEKAVETVREQTRPVVREQSQGNQNRFVSLGVKARQLGVVPYILEPTCDEYKGVISSEDGVTLMLQLIAQKTEQRLTRYWRRNQGVLQEQAPLIAPATSASGAAAAASAPAPSALPPAASAPAPTAVPRANPNGIVLAYGGAMHNDVNSPPDGQNFRYGAHMVQLTGGRYLELDLIVPEYIKDSEVWKALPWYSAYAALGPSDQVTLYQVGPYSYTLIFARSAAAVSNPAASSTSAAQPQAD